MNGLGKKTVVGKVEHQKALDEVARLRRYIEVIHRTAENYRSDHPGLDNYPALAAALGAVKGYTGRALTTSLPVVEGDEADKGSIK